MDRRKLLKSIGALGLAPLLPNAAFALPATNTASATIATEAFSRSYQLAEMLVRSHNKCSTAMLERLLCVDAGTASAVKSELLKRGVIGINANAYGIHTATKPFQEVGLLNSQPPTERISEAVKKQVEESFSEHDENLKRNENPEQAATENTEEFEDEPLAEEETSIEDVLDKDTQTIDPA